VSHAAPPPWHGYVPKLLTVLRQGYGVADFRADLVAGLTVAIVALPLAMALAIASGTTPEKGLHTAIVAGFLISALGGSRVQIGGPTAAFIPVVFNVIERFGYGGLILCTLLAGLMLIAAGMLRLGTLMRYMPQPVVTGFTAGIAVTIFTSQVKDLLGLPLQRLPGEFLAKWKLYLAHLGDTNLYAFALALACLGLILALRRWRPGWPAFLLAVIVGALAALQLPVATIGSTFGEIPSTLPTFAIPHIPFERTAELFPASFTIAFLAGVESLLSAVVADGMTGGRHRSNMELVAQGVANCASALCAGLPATGAIARTATNIRAGARSPVAGLLHAAFLLAFMLLLAPLMRYVPFAALAAVLLIVAWNMSEIERFRHLMRAPWGRSRGAAGDLRSHRGLRPHHRDRGGRGAGGIPVHAPHERVGGGGEPCRTGRVRRRGSIRRERNRAARQAAARGGSLPHLGPAVLRGGEPARSRARPVPLPARTSSSYACARSR
jgi:SulP family sulfate permease